MKYDWQHDSIPILQLGPDYFDPAVPATFPMQKLRYWNSPLSHQILDKVQLKLPKENFWDFKPLPNNLKEPLALRYHGHQFQSYNPQLGDGRGFLFAQLQIGDQWYDFGTKGSGTTKYSRNGDGRLTLKGAVREALATELLQSLGVTTSKTLCFFETGEKLVRGDEPSPTRSAVLTRFSLGHIRFGTFQRLAFLKEVINIKKLVSYCLEFYYKKEIENHPVEDPVNAVELFLDLVSRRHAKLAAQVMMAGFVHGVLNTDNMNISGELFDYGPYRFLPDYDPDFTAAYFDQQGLYSYGRQPATFLWNLLQLANALQVAYPKLEFKNLQENFSLYFNENLTEQFLKRLNIKPIANESVTDQISLFFQMMVEKKVPFEKAFYDFHSGDSNLFKNFTVADESKAADDYFKRGAPEALLIDEIETIWNAIDQHDDWSLFNDKLQSIRAFRGIYD